MEDPQEYKNISQVVREGWLNRDSVLHDGLDFKASGDNVTLFNILHEVINRPGQLDPETNVEWQEDQLEGMKKDQWECVRLEAGCSTEFDRATDNLKMTFSLISKLEPNSEELADSFDVIARGLGKRIENSASVASVYPIEEVGMEEHRIRGLDVMMKNSKTRFGILVGTVPIVDDKTHKTAYKKAILVNMNLNNKSDFDPESFKNFFNLVSEITPFLGQNTDTLQIPQ